MTHGMAGSNRYNLLVNNWLEILQQISRWTYLECPSHTSFPYLQIHTPGHIGEYTMSYAPSDRRLDNFQTNRFPAVQSQSSGLVHISHYGEFR
jgi:hypothetical protein